MERKGILGFLEEKLNNGAENVKHSAKEISGYHRMIREAADISQSLGLVYREQSPLPLPKDMKYGDPLQASNNAITHAYMSAKLAQRYGALAAKEFGNLREWKEAPASEDEVAAESWDVYKDMWNNEVGRRIGSSVSIFDDQALIEAIKDAWRKGDLIVTRTDGRIPKNYRYTPKSISEFDTGSVRMKAKLPDPLRKWNFTPY